MRGVLLKSFLALLLVAEATPLPSHAQAIEPGREGQLAVLVRPKAGERACYARIYDKKHLDAHPHQKVTEMHFRLAYHVFPSDKFFPKGQRNYYFQLLARLHGRSKPLKAIGECGPTQDGKGIFCGVECDGGGVMITPRDGGRLLVDLQSTGRIRMTEGCDDDEENGVELEPGRDDRTFLLSPAKPDECPAYEDW